MRRLMSGVAALALAGCATTSGMQGSAAPQSELTEAGMNAAFEKIGQSYLDILTELNPVYATQLGDHAHDGDLPDVSAAGRERELKLMQGVLIALKTIDPAQLTAENRVDYELLRNAIEYQIWSIETEQQWAWNPQYYHNIASSALYSLVSRDFAPWPDRFENIVQRMEKMPAFLEVARAQVDVARVPKVHAETVAKQNAGIMAIVNSVLLPEVEQSGVERSRFDAALSGLKQAMAEHQRWLDETVVPGAQGNFRLGDEQYAQKMRYALATDMSVAQLKNKAEAAYTATRAQMATVSRAIEGCDLPDEQAAIECGLEKSYADRATRTTLEDRARETLAQATEFTRAQNLVRMPDGPVQIITMPKFWQGNAVAYLDAPAPLERQLPAYYAVSPVPEDWSDEQATSFLKEYNISMLHLLSIHEGVPGHYLQLDHSNKHPSLLRAVLASGPFIEGWAVYSEKVMADENYLGGMETEAGRFFIVNGLKFRLRAIINTLLDIGIHTEDMAEGEAMALMISGGFQQEREAAGKWIRANLTSVQLLSYYTGYEEHLALRREAVQRWGGDFDQRKYHDQVLSFGSPPAKYVRQLMFD